MTALREFQAVTGHMVAAVERLDTLDQHRATLVSDYGKVYESALRAHQDGRAASGEVARLKEIADLLKRNEEAALAIIDELQLLLIKASGSHHG